MTNPHTSPHRVDLLAPSPSRNDLIAKNKPREYLLDDPTEFLRLMRECRGYLHTCHHKHGTDWEGRKFAIEALEKLARNGGSSHGW